MKKRAIIIGAGAQGNVVAGVLSAADDVDAVVLADLGIDRANEVAQAIGSPKVKAAQVDASDLDALTALIGAGG